MLNQISVLEEDTSIQQVALFKAGDMKHISDIEDFMEGSKVET